MPWINSREGELDRGDGVASRGLRVFPSAFFLLLTEVLLSFAFFLTTIFLGATFLGVVFLAALDFPMAFLGLAERGPAALDRVLPFFAVCVGVAII